MLCAKSRRMTFDNMKSVLISGATGGIGGALARLFAKRGWRLALVYHSNQTAADKLYSDLSELTEVKLYSCDFSSFNYVTRLGDEVLNEFGCPDAVIHNAGVASYGLFQDVTEEDFQRLFSINFESAFFLTKCFASKMITRQSGSIVNVSSVWGQTGASCEVLYSSSKSAMIGFTKALAKELAPSGIRVNCIAPGVVDTDMMRNFSEEELSSIREEIPMGRFADPKEIAQACYFLASDESSYITGQVLGVNGGFYC